MIHSYEHVIMRRVISASARHCHPVTSHPCQSTQGISNLGDNLEEVLSLNDVTVIIGEWIPFGMNLIRELNDKLGSTERVQVSPAARLPCLLW